MAQFATSDELAVRLGLTFTSAEETRADALLTLVSGIIQAETGQTIEEGESTLSLRGSATGYTRLPQRPIVSVTSVELAGVAQIEDVDWYLEGDLLVRTNGWGHSAQELVIEYEHGYAEIPSVVTAVCLEVAVRLWTNPANVRQEGYGSEQVSYQESPGMLLTTHERFLLRKLGWSMTSVGLR